MTIADFGAQAVLISAIHAAFPDDIFVGEEDSAALRGEQATPLREAVAAVVASVSSVGDGKSAVLCDEDAMLETIDLGGSGKGGPEGRVWMLDPVDGTESFMRGRQYAVALCLVVDGVQKVGVLGCPNLNLEQGTVREDIVEKEREGLGWLLYAIEGHGAWKQKMSMTGLGPCLEMPRTDLEYRTRELRLVESTTRNRDVPRQRAVARAMGAEWPGSEIWSMQMKYIALAVGGDDVMVRISAKEYRGYVWDHAGGQLIYAETGGVVTDAEGKQFDFGRGRKLKGNWGIVAAGRELHARVFEEVRKVVDGSVESL